MKPTAADSAAIDRAALLLGIKPLFLHRIIKAESNYNPQAANPFSTAKGLIQFTDGTARTLGYSTSAALVSSLPSIPSQVEKAVYPYLRKYAPFQSQADLYLSVFYPPARKWPLFKKFPDFVRKVNPGINTPADYFFRVAKSIASPLTPFVPFAILGAVFVFALSGQTHGRKAR